MPPLPRSMTKSMLRDSDSVYEADKYSSMHFLLVSAVLAACLKLLFLSL